MRTTLRNTLVSMGVTPTGTYLRQMEVFCKAMRVFQLRNVVHRDLWEQDSLDETAAHIRSKAKRIDHFTQTDLDQLDAGVRETLLDSAYDLINYTAFLVRKLERER